MMPVTIAAMVALLSGILAGSGSFEPYRRKTYPVPQYTLVALLASAGAAAVSLVAYRSHWPGGCATPGIQPS
jgi:hypothetical protein